MHEDPNNPVRLIDDLIDDVAREITGARPIDDNEDFARRVSVRIKDNEAARTPRAWWRAWVLVPAAAGVLVLAVLILRQVQSPNAPTETASGLRPETASGLRAQGSGLGEVQPSALGGPQPLAGRARPRVVRAAPAQPGLSGDPDFQPLTTEPIEMASLDVSPLVVAMPIEVSAIAIERIEIAAMP